MSCHYDVVIVGAGLRGLVAAKIFLELEPQLRLVIFESGASVGGVWAEQNIFPGLKSNNLVGTYEYTDFPMDEKFGVKYPEHIPGEVIAHYFRQYADQNDLMKRIELKTKVISAEKTQEGWNLGLQSLPNRAGYSDVDRHQEIRLPIQRYITCSKLIVATGLTSSPRSLNIEGRNDFEAPVLHYGDFAQQAGRICEDMSIQKVTVYGGGKAAHDIVYLMAMHGKQVNWVIRKSGYGPTYMAPSHVFIGPFRCWLEKLTATRPLTWFSPCVWGDADGFSYLRSCLHGTRVGRWIVNAFWDKLGSDLVAQTHIAEHEETRKLMPHQPPFWYGTNLSILNYGTGFYNLVRRGGIKVLRKDVKNLASQKTVCFTDGTSIRTDAFICSTGWNFKSSIDFQPPEIHADLGIPSTEYSSTQEQRWNYVENRADLEILTRFPKLQEGPKIGDDLLSSSTIDTTPINSAGVKTQGKSLNPWRLWRGIAPPSLPSRDLVFLGNVICLQGALLSEISSIWAFAYLFSKFKAPLRSITKPEVPLQLGLQQEDYPNQEQEKILYDTALFNRFGRWRHPYGYGSRHPDAVFDGLPYLDLLLQDLGLRSWRKGWGWLGEIFGGSYGQADYRGLVQEWKDSQGRRQ